MAIVSVTLTVLYFSFRTHLPPAVRHYQVTTNNECVEKAKRIRKANKVGKVYLFCNGRRI